MRISLLALFLSVTLIIISSDCSGLVDSSIGTQTTNTLTPKVGNRVYQMAPDFKLGNLEGNAVSLSDFRGSPVMINFWRID
ncbi:MAG: redoxin domain-containing protein [Dehalococcoidia bacterium]|nr:MAG: redoxin domain-containing protein [Dehalococcoidia bacterium]